MGDRIHGRGGVPAETDDYLRFSALQNRTHFALFAAPPPREGERVLVRAARERDFFHRIQLVAGLRDEIVFKSDRRADDAQPGIGFNPPDGVRDGQQRVHVSGGTAAGQYDIRHAFSSPRGLPYGPVQYWS